MSDYIFLEGDLPPASRYVFPIALFNRPAYRTLYSTGEWRSYYLLLSEDNTVHAHVHFHIQEKVAESPLRAPFGSIECVSTISTEVLLQFVNKVESALNAADIGCIRIKNPPSLYDQAHAARLEQVFSKRGYVVELEEQTSIIPLADRTLSSVLHHRKRRKLMQSKRDSLLFRKLDPNALDDVYRFILECRARKNYKLSITLEELRNAFHHFPDEYGLYAVYYHNRVVAASVTVRVRADVMYHFISDHARKIGSSSAVLILMEGIYQDCLEKGIRLLDLGTSNAGGVPDMSLMRFKFELGGVHSEKLMWVKCEK